MKNIDIKRVRYFLRLAETLNFSATARDFNVSQPALTKAISRLETEVGGRLIRREGINTHLTPLGFGLKEHFVELNESALRAQQAAERLVRGDMPILRIGLMCTIGPRPLARFLSGFSAQLSDLEYVITDLARDNLAKKLLDGECDVALVGAEIDSQRIRHHQLYTEPMVMACAQDHALARRKEISTAEIAQQPYVDRLQCEFRETFLTEAHRNGFQPEFAGRSDREEWAQALVAAGLGVTLLPARSVVVPGLRLVPATDPYLERNVSIAVPIGREDTNTIQQFLRAVRQYDWTPTAAPNLS